MKTRAMLALIVFLGGCTEESRQQSLDASHAAYMEQLRIQKIRDNADAIYRDQEGKQREKQTEINKQERENNLRSQVQ